MSAEFEKNLKEKRDDRIALAMVGALAYIAFRCGIVTGVNKMMKQTKTIANVYSHVYSDAFFVTTTNQK